MKIRAAVALAVAIAAGPTMGLVISAPARAADVVSFKQDVLHVFDRHCMPCHAPDGEGAKADGMVLTNYADVMKGTKYGPMIVAGDPNASNLMRLLDWKVSPQLRMPHNQKQLSSYERDLVRNWIKQGAKDN